ncbi:hypothetical protein PGT21_019619 [Puccinia graminis f. sp. tritici]|uniref:Uncharacterized protein n=1 Tax=Puccinia graminis f. sp. tritici TaxID=56615 RepID=A0A5B0QAQ8_PUCGR|nr:hypothetical protein PGT21_019619 [Puccinia graminis f. sp. tritici]KAA1134907.1 hypothetical protein PGTUg99_016355 [Puccinia graminis f. sp. tritici]
MHVTILIIPLALVILSIVQCMHLCPKCNGGLSLSVTSRRCDMCNHNSNNLIQSISAYCIPCQKSYNEVATICGKCGGQKPNRSWHLTNCPKDSKIEVSAYQESITCNRCNRQHWREKRLIICHGCDKSHPSYSSSVDQKCPCTYGR